MDYRNVFNVNFKVNTSSYLYTKRSPKYILIDNVILNKNF